MDSSWFDGDDLGLGLSRRWTSLASHGTAGVAASAGHLSFLEESRGLELELQTTSSRLRESARLAVNGHAGLLGSGFASRRLDLAQRINTLMRSTGDGGKYTHGEYDELDKNFRVIKEENLKLKAVITDVTEVNKRWQKYNNDRQIYVQRLLSTIQDQQDQINKMVANSAFLSPAKLLAEGVETGSLQEDVARLQRQIEQLQREHSETVDVLKFQVKAHHDDWEAERQEKQQALQDKLAAEAKIRQLQKDLRTHKLKLREERLENENRCSCCCVHACEPDQNADISKPSARLNYCRNENTKTYRTSVHVPCNAGHLLSRGTTLSFGDDLVIDGEENIDNLAPTLNEITTTSRSNSDKYLQKSPTTKTEEKQELPVHEDLVVDSAHNLGRKGAICSKYQATPNSTKNNWQDLVHSDSVDLSDLPQLHPTCMNESKIHVPPQTDSQSSATSTSQLSCSVLHIPSTHSSSTVSLPSESTQCEAPSGVTIGFNNSGLVSVLSFPQTPIVKSFSLPNPKDSKSGQTMFVEYQPTPPQGTLGLAWSGLPVASPPETFTVSAESLFQEKKPSKLSLLGAFAKSVKQSQQSTFSPAQCSRNSEETKLAANREVSWKPKYFEEGVDTQTREDIICPVCDLLFPPTSHVKFLDHFGKCQNNEIEQKLKRV